MFWEGILRAQVEKREHFPDGEVTAKGCGHLAFPYPLPFSSPSFSYPFCLPCQTELTINIKDKEKEKSHSIQKP